jgi:hypothetical protein
MKDDSGATVNAMYYGKLLENALGEVVIMITNFR